MPEEIRIGREKGNKPEVKAPPVQPFSPPVIVLASPTPGSETEREQIEVTGVVQAAGSSVITDIRILVNGETVKAAGGHDIGGKAKEKNRVDLRQAIILQPGENRIEVVARDDHGRVHRESLTVRHKVARGQMAAVVIGIDRYQSVRQLQFASADARSFYDYLVGEFGIPKERIRLLLNEEATLRNLKSAMGTWLPRISGPQDTVLIYYAGHGAPEEDASSPDGDSLARYLLPVEAQAEDLYGTAFGKEEVRAVLGRVRARRLLFLADACFSGALGGRTIARPAGSRDVAVSGKFLERLAQGEGRVILTASGPDELSREEPKLGHGVFTYYLLKGLRGAADADRNGYVTLPEAYEYVSREVAQATGQKQRPVLKGELSGEIVLGVLGQSRAVQ